MPKYAFDGPLTTPLTPVNLKTIQVHKVHIASERMPSSLTDMHMKLPALIRFIKSTNIQQTTDDAVDIDKIRLLRIFKLSSPAFKKTSSRDRNVTKLKIRV